MADDVSMSGLRVLVGSLRVLQVCMALCLEGSTRVTATEVSERVATEFGKRLHPTEAGQVLRALKVETTKANGKDRFMLDAGVLGELLKQCKEAISATEKRIKAVLSTFKDMPARISELEAELARLSEMVRRERVLKEKIEYLGYVERALPHLLREVESRQAIIDKWNETKEREARLKAFIFGSDERREPRPEPTHEPGQEPRPEPTHDPLPPTGADRVD